MITNLSELRHVAAGDEGRHLTLKALTAPSRFLGLEAAQNEINDDKKKDAFARDYLTKGGSALARQHSESTTLTINGWLRCMNRFGPRRTTSASCCG